ncbi:MULTISPECIES: hypothetical protein [Bacillaceae]|uniref:Uncharacterized protein n=1 Tax=Domibacillus aminovorans TaxID=29332 RepID=A0A177KRD5_9BACI|nr:MULTISPECIES: hypothetical protein [Bacillaceae]OAH55764.1 hypothetical protein AWH48_03555 [Domibacillus aminovorans]
MRGFYEQQIDALKGLVSNEEPFIEQLNGFFLQKPKDTNLLRKDIMEEILKSNSELNSLVKEYQQKTIPIFLEWIEKGRKQGYVKEGISNELILYYYNMMAAAMENLYKQLADHPDIDQIFQQLKHMFFMVLSRNQSSVRHASSVLKTLGTVAKAEIINNILL